MLRIQKISQWSNPKIRAIDLRSIYPLTNLYQLQLEEIMSLKSYGQFWSTSTQSMVGPSTPVQLTYNNSGPLKAMTYVGSQIRVQLTGIYQIGFSVQFARASGNASTICDVWLRVNNNDLPDTATKVVTPQGPTTSQIFMTVPIMVSLNANDYIEVVFATDDSTNTKAYYFPAQTGVPGVSYTRPAIPSVITTIIQIA